MSRLSPERSSKHSYGELYLIVGPMFGGKTQRLTYELAVHEGLDHKILLVGPECDDRDEDESIMSSGIFSTHRLTPNRLERNITEIVVKDLNEIPEKYISETDVIGIDEGQFFSGIKDTVLNWVMNLNKTVYVAGLLATSEGNMFGELYQLIPFVPSQNFIKIDAVCVDCKKELDILGVTGIRPPAWLNNCTVEKSGEVLVGSDVYTPVCLKHWTGK